MADKQILTVPEVARLAHETNRAWCEMRGDTSQVPWAEAPAPMKAVVNSGIQNRLEDPGMSPDESHENWMGEMVDAGWVYGETKNAEASPPTHPNILPYEDLPVDQQIKDHLFRAIVHALEPFTVRD